MPKTEDGEFELILGNRQLLSVFFIVVVLLGVFFTMGYIVGRNSAPGATADARKTEGKPIVVDSATQQPSPSGAPVPAAQDTASGQQPAAESGAGTQPVPSAEPQTPAAAEPKAPPPAEPKPEPQRASRPEPASPTPGEPQPGSTYLQVAAVARPEAELFVDVLAKKGFHAIYAQHPDQPKLYRVLIGPFRDAAAIAQARADLNKAGFKGFEALQRKF